MKKITKVVFVMVFILILLSVGLFGLGYFKKSKAAILIESTPTSIVYINNEQVGRTPYEGAFKSEEIVVKLIPEAFEKPLSPYETKVKLISGVRTVIRREFGELNSDSSGEVISFEKTGSNETSLSVVSIPDSAQVSLDGSIVGFTPLIVDKVTPAEHQVSISATGYNSKNFAIVAHEGYRLTAIVNLSKSQEEAPKQELQEHSEGQEMIELEIKILETPVGYLRVREGPSTSSKEVGRVLPGQVYRVLEEDEETGWYKIEYEQGKEGWVSSDYGEKLEKEKND